VEFRGSFYSMGICGNLSKAGRSHGEILILSQDCGLRDSKGESTKVTRFRLFQNIEF
jgi:hypothetical protein